MVRNKFYGPRSKKNAHALIQAALELGYPVGAVKTVTGGYFAPVDVVDALEGIEEIKEGVVYPAPVQEDSEEQKTPEEPEVDEPPRQGPSATREVWAAHAATVGVDVSDGDSRNDIIAKIDARKEGK